MLDIDILGHGDELPADTTVTCCNVVMDGANGIWTCASSSATCRGYIETLDGLIFNIRY